MVLTSRGWGVVAAAGGLLVLARLFGSAELAGLAAAAGAAVAVAAFVVGRAPLTYRGDRWLAPTRVGVGAPAEARLRFTNTGPRPTTATAVATDVTGPTPRRSAGNTLAEGPSGLPTVTVGKPLRLRGPASAGCRVPPLGPGAIAESRYDLPTGLRGAVTVGPLVLRVGDPFGLAERQLTVAGAARLVVHPRIHPVLALPGSSTRDARLGRTRPARAPRGDDFFALREYEVGDDLRRVHWRSTARTGDLMLRQDEVRNGSVATVLVDTRATAHRGDSFERALEVALSIAAALFEDGRRLRLLTTGGFDVEIDGARARSRRAQADGRWATLLEHLALVTPDAGGGDRLAGAIQSVRRGPSGPLAAVMADPAAGELAALGGLRARLPLVVIATCAAGTSAVPAAPGASDSAVGHRRAGAVLVSVAEPENFPEAWNQVMRSCGRCDPVRR